MSEFLFHRPAKHILQDTYPDEVLVPGFGSFLQHNPSVTWVHQVTGVRVYRLEVATYKPFTVTTYFVKSDMGVERCVRLDGLTEAQIDKKLEELARAGDSLKAK